MINYVKNIYNQFTNNASYLLSKTLKTLKPRGDFKINQIDYYLYQGNTIKNEDEMNQLKEKGIKHVISIMEPWEWKYDTNNFTLDDTFTQHFFSVPDCLSPGIEYINECVKLINTIKETYPEDHIYIHCYYGRGRSAVMIYAYLMENYKLTMREIDMILPLKINNIFVNYKQRRGISHFEELKFAPQI